MNIWSRVPFIILIIGMEVVVDVRVDMFVGIAVPVDIDPLIVRTNWGVKPAMPSLDE